MQFNKVKEQRWIFLANKLIKVERNELAKYTKAKLLINRASNEAHDRLMKIPGATPIILQKIYTYTICVADLLSSQNIYDAYLPHLEREIDKKSNLEIKQ